MSDWETERVTEVWNNQSGEHYSVGSDRDGMGLVEIRSFVAESEKALERISMPVEVAIRVAQAILREYSEVPTKTD
jgi:phage terminase large subunit-like protein